MSNEQNESQALPSANSSTEPNAGASPAPGTHQQELAGESTPPSLEEQLRAAQLLAAEHHDAWLRAKADAENIRRRAQEDVAKAHKFGIERFAAELLPVKDSLEAALADQSATVDILRAGVELTDKQLTAAFEKSGLQTINPAGEKFDPHRHQAIGMVDSDQAPNTVVTVLQKGYLIAERVLRPALVMVAKAKD